MSRRLAAVLAVILGAIAFLVVQGLGNATTFYRNADEAVAQRRSLEGDRFRLQGVVRPGTISATETGVAFVVEWDCVTVPVRHSGNQPAGLKDGIPVVLEGEFQRGSAKTYASDRIMVRHTDNYRTEESKQAETDAERCAS